MKYGAANFANINFMPNFGVLLIPYYKIMNHTEAYVGGHRLIIGFIGDYLIIMVNWLGENDKCQKIMLTLR